MSETWTIGELAERAADALRPGLQRANGRIREVPGERLIRWYTTIGLVDPPLTRRGRIAQYGRRHLLQVVAVKRLQAEGHSIADIQTRLTGATDATLEATALLPGVPAPPSTPGVPAPALPGAPAPTLPGVPAPPRPGAPTPQPPGAPAPGVPAPTSPGVPAPSLSGGPEAPARFWTRADADRRTGAPDSADVTARRTGAGEGLTTAGDHDGSLPTETRAPEARESEAREAEAREVGARVADSREAGARAAAGPETRARAANGREAEARVAEAREAEGRVAIDREAGARVAGVRLGDGVVLVFDGGSRTPNDDDIEAVLAAAGPLIQVLQERKLA